MISKGSVFASQKEKNLSPDITGFSSEYTTTVTVENIKDKLIEFKSLNLDEILDNKSKKDLQIINSLIIELKSQRLLTENNIVIVLQYYAALRYIIDEFYHADHTYHYKNKFSSAKDAHFKINYWQRERAFIEKLFQYKYLLPTLADYLKNTDRYSPEIILYAKNFDVLMNTKIYGLWASTVVPPKLSSRGTRDLRGDPSLLGMTGARLGGSTADAALCKAKQQSPEIPTKEDFVTKLIGKTR